MCPPTTHKGYVGPGSSLGRRGDDVLLANLSRVSFFPMNGMFTFCDITRLGGRRTDGRTGSATNAGVYKDGVYLAHLLRDEITW